MIIFLVRLKTSVLISFVSYHIFLLSPTEWSSPALTSKSRFFLRSYIYLFLRQRKRRAAKRLGTRTSTSALFLTHRPGVEV